MKTSRDCQGYCDGSHYTVPAGTEVKKVRNGYAVASEADTAAIVKSAYIAKYHYLWVSETELTSV